MTEQTDFAAIPALTLGWRIQLALDHRGLKQTDLMDEFEISRGTVSRWCRDVGPAPKKFVLNQIAVMCGVSSRWLITGEDSPNQPEPPSGATGPQSPNSGRWSSRDSAGQLVRLRAPRSLDRIAS